MKQLQYIVCLLTLFTFVPVLAQQEDPVIKVSGHAAHFDDATTYTALVSISTALSSYASEAIGLEELKNRYRKALNDVGIAWEELEEEPQTFGFEVLGYEQKGTIYEFSTTSSDKMRRFLAVKSFGVQRLRDQATFTIDKEESQRLIEKALANAKEKAESVARAMGKKLGPIKEIEDFNNRWGQQVENALYYDVSPSRYKCYINVVYYVEHP